MESNLTRLGVGDNMLKPDAGAGANAPEVDIDFAMEKVGVYV